MKRTVYVAGLILVLASCKSKDKTTPFEVSGSIVNSPENMVYLEEIPMGTLESVRVDSATLKDGKYTLRSRPRESTAYIIRVGNHYDQPPLAAIINDAPKITVNATYEKGATFTESYEVTGSKASLALKEFMLALNSRLQNVYFNSVKIDSLRNVKGSDSAITALRDENMRLATDARTLLSTSINQSNDPALSMFELGNYTVMSNNPAFGLVPLTKDDIKEIVTATAKKFPSHARLSSLSKQVSNRKDSLQGWVGKEAPEISLPDVNGNMVKLSSYRGKYVLVDFWASWCSPCRRENPNVVAAYNKFRSDKFDILGVSLDNPGEKDKWLEAIKDDKLVWTQISDLKGWSSEVVPVYQFGEEGIPYNILVDPQGKIIAERLQGPALEIKLREVLNK